MAKGAPSSILSNVKIQGQKLFGNFKDGVVEAGLFGSSLNKAINGVESAAKENFDDVVKGISALKSEGVKLPNDPEGLLKTVKDISKDREGTISGIGHAMSEGQAEQVKNAAAMRMVKKTNGLMRDDNLAAYDGILKSTKGAVVGNTAKNMGEQYFIDPVRDLVNAKKAGNKDVASEALNKVVSRSVATVGATAGVVGTSSILGNINKDKEIMKY